MSRVGKSATKPLFDDDEAAVDEKLKLNSAYAAKYDVVKRKQELQKLESKYGKGDDGSEDEEETEDEDAVAITPQKEEAFADLLLKLRTGDEALLDASRRFFPQSDSEEQDGDDNADTLRARRKHTLKDEYQRGVARTEEAGLEEDDRPEEETVRSKLRKGPQTAEEIAAKKAFLMVASKSDDGLEIKRKPTLPPTEQSRLNAQAKKKLQKAFEAAPKQSADEAFLAKYFMNSGWIVAKEEEDDNEADEPGDDGYDGYTLEQADADEAEEHFFDEAEQWEQEYQQKKYRHEEGDEALRVATHPRDEEGLLRKKDTARKDARERKKEREQKATVTATEELKRLKHLKMLEIEDQRRLIQEVAGMRDAQRLAKLQEQLAEDYDPESFDKLMSSMFGEEYYAEEDERIAAELEELEEREEGGAEEEGEDDGANEKAHAANDELSFLYPTSEGMLGEQRASEAEFQDAHDVDAPEAATRAKRKAAQTQEELEAKLEQKVDEYWRLHYDSIVGGVRTRFKYRTVPAENFGLTDEDVILMDDRTLNMRTPMNCYATYLTPADNKRDRYRSLHREKNLRTLPSDRRSRRYARDTVVFREDEAEGEELAAKVVAASKKLTADLDRIEASARGTGTGTGTGRKRPRTADEPGRAGRHRPPKDT